MIRYVKSIVIGLSTALLLTACTTKNEDSEAKEDIKHTSIKKNSYAKKMLEKRNNEKKAKRTKVDLKKFCFKDNRSIHYRATERCK